MSDRTYQLAQSISDSGSVGLITLAEEALTSRRRLVVKGETKNRGDFSLRARLAGTTEDEKNDSVAKQSGSIKVS